jgi:DNA-binding response OmpR family regulator
MSAAPRHRLLIVDDEESTRLLIARLLSRGMKIEPQLAGTTEQALRLARNYAYDAILLDLLMPGMGGLELLRQIRRSSANMATPVLIVSVLADRESMQRCRDAGADGQVTKPFTERTLTAAVRRLLAARGKTRIP